MIIVKFEPSFSGRTDPLFFFLDRFAVYTRLPVTGKRWTKLNNVSVAYGYTDEKGDNQDVFSKNNIVHAMADIEDNSGN